MFSFAAQIFHTYFQQRLICFENSNRVSGKRIFIEHLMCRLKVFWILSHQFRLNSRRYRTVMLAICGLFRLKLGRIDFTIYDC